MKPAPAPVTAAHRRLVWLMSEALKTYGTPTEAEQMLADFVAKGATPTADCPAPETEAVKFKTIRWTGSQLTAVEVVFAEFAARLERERNYAQSELLEQGKLLKCASDREAKALEAAKLATEGRWATWELDLAKANGKAMSEEMRADALAAQVQVLREALQYYAEEAHWSDETTATEGGDEDVKIITANACIFFYNGDCWRKAQDALASTPATASAELAALKEERDTLRAEVTRLKTLNILGADSLKSPQDIYAVIPRSELAALREGKTQFFAGFDRAIAKVVYWLDSHKDRARSVGSNAFIESEIKDLKELLGALARNRASAAVPKASPEAFEASR